MLHCFPDCRAISLSRPGSYRRAPAVTTRRRNVAWASSLCSDHTVGRTLQPALNVYKPWAMLSWPFGPQRPGTDEHPRRSRLCEAALSDVNQPALGRQCHGLRAPNGVELFQNSRHVIFHGVLADVEHLADFLIAFAKGHLLQHLKFALG
jgi:hypothetical protein